MRILLIHNYYQYYGGEETYFESLVKLLKSKGHEVVTYTKNSNNIGKGLLPKMKVAFGFFWNHEVEKELSQLIKDFKPEIAHFNNIYPLITAVAYRVCRKFNIPIVQTIHNYRFMCPKGILFRNGKICELCINKKHFPFPSIFFSCYHHSFFSSLVFSLAFSFHKLIGSFNLINKYIFPSEFTKDYYLKNLNIPREKIAVIPQFVNIKKEWFKKTSEKNYFLFVGRLSEEKGIIELLNIFKDLSNIKLIVLGDGPLKEKINKYKKYNNIEMIGFLSREKVISYIKQARCIIIPSICYEVFPISSIESLILNKFIIIPNNDNFKSLFKNKYHKLTFFDNFNDLKDKIINIFKKRGYNFRKNIDINLFDSSSHYTKIINTYNKLLRL